MKIILITSLIVLSLTINSSLTAKEFKYFNGRCIDNNGRVGLNQISQEELEASLDGECGNFQDGLLNLHFTNSLNESDKINLRGAVIKDVALQFIYVYADFSGADVTISTLGYHVVKGLSDQYSKFVYENILLGQSEEINLGVGPFCLSDSSGC